MSAQSPVRFAQVVAVDPRFRSCEVVFMDDGWRASNVPILHNYMSSNTGAWSMHNMPRPPGEELAGGLQPNIEDRMVIAVVVMIEARPVIVGFQPHPLTQLAFILEEQNRDLWRHPSGTLATINKNGSLEIQHTGGTFIRIANEMNGDPVQHEDLTPLCANENWALPENEPATVTVSSGEFRLVVRPNGDTEMLSGGNLVVTFNGNGDLTFHGNVTARISGSLTASAGGDVRVRTPASAIVSAQEATVQAVGDAHVYAGGTANVVAGGNAELLAAGGASVHAGGSISVGAEGPITIASASTLTLAAPEITALTELFVVTGELVEGSASGASAAAAIALATPMAVAAVAAGAMAAAAAAPEVAAAQADAEAAVLAGEEAERVAIETSEPAIGIAPPDNLGLANLAGG